MVSISLDSDYDTPEILAEYAEDYEAGPGWIFCTGDYDEIDGLRRKLGLYDPDPEIDADKTQHAGLVVYGNEPKGRWAASPGQVRPSLIVRSLRRIL